MRRTLKFLTAAAVAAMPALAGAQAVNFVGSTLGCFYQGAGSCSPSTFASVGTLSYTSGTFNFFTDPVGNSGTSYGAVGNANPLNSHGSITSTGPFSSTAGPNQWYLRLQTTVTSPTLSGGNVFTDDFSILGSTQAISQGGLHFTPLTNPLYAGPFSNGVVFNQPLASASGTVDFWNYDNQSVTAGSTVYLSSFLQITAEVTTPEPASLALMATGVLALAGVGYSRRRS